MKRERISLAIVIIISCSLAIFFGFRKENYHVDEVWNYGLANNIGSIVPAIEYGKEYSGMGPFEEYVEVSPEHRFNYINVWKNQANDVHPPLYYMFFHTVCSFFPNTFSNWYGIGLNIFWLAITLIILYLLGKEILKDSFSSLAFVLIYGMAISTLDTTIYIRMYSQFTLMAVFFAYLIKLYWDKPLTKKFYILAGVNLIAGVMTHYYFLIYAFFLCALFCINLFVKKQYAELRKSILTFWGAGIIYLLIWHHILGHIFRGSRGQEAIGKAASLFDFSSIISMFSVINGYFFSHLILLFLIFAIVIILIKRKNHESLWSFECALFLSGFFYAIVIGKVSPYTTGRYVSPVGFIIILAAFMSARKILALKLKDATIDKILIIFFLVLNLANYSLNGFYLSHDYHSTNLDKTIEQIKDEKVVEYVSSDWEMLSNFKVLTSVKSYAFIDDNTAADFLKHQKEDFVLMLYEKEPQEVFPGLECELISSHGASNYYLVHM
ncbi:MAG: hypothetical protein IJR96_01115 [Pseudobutyrivibrio sp.]|nr:hypothetical protein [Pseudobutyrivibrio sp.]